MILLPLQDSSQHDIANLQKMVVAEGREAEPTTQHRNGVGLTVRQATIVLLAESCRQKSFEPINVSFRSHTEPFQPTKRFLEIFGRLLGPEQGMEGGVGQTCDFP